MYRYHPQITKVIDLIKQNYIGNLTEMQSYYGINLMKKKFLYFFTKNKTIDKNHRLFNKKTWGWCNIRSWLLPIINEYFNSLSKV